MVNQCYVFFFNYLGQVLIINIYGPFKNHYKFVAFNGGCFIVKNNLIAAQHVVSRHTYVSFCITFNINMVIFAEFIKNNVYLWIESIIGYNGALFIEDQFLITGTSYFI